MPNQTHICIAITKSNMGGAQKYVLTLAEELTKKGKKVTVLAGGDGILFDELDKKSIQYIKLSQSQRDISILKEFKLAYELYCTLKKIRPTVLHLNSSKLGGVGSLIGKCAGIKTIIFTAHGWAFNEARPRWQKISFHILYWITILLSTKTICVSNQTREQIIHMPFIKNKLVTIYNGIQTPEFYTQEEARELLYTQFPFLDIHKRWIVVLAELHYVKGHDILIEALHSIKESLSQYQIVCIGSGQEEGKLKALIHYKTLDSQVFFTGFVANASRYLKAFEALCLPSRTEALPLCILEAGLATIPVIASDVGGIPEIIRNNVSGFLFKKENTKELAEKIKFFLDLPDPKKSELAQELNTRVLTSFSLEKMITETISLYDLGFEYN